MNREQGGVIIGRAGRRADTHRPSAPGAQARASGRTEKPACAPPLELRIASLAGHRGHALLLVDDVAAATRSAAARSRGDSDFQLTGLAGTFRFERVPSGRAGGALPDSLVGVTLEYVGYARGLYQTYNVSADVLVADAANLPFVTLRVLALRTVRAVPASMLMTTVVISYADACGKLGDARARSFLRENEARAPGHRPREEKPRNQGAGKTAVAAR